MSKQRCAICDKRVPKKYIVNEVCKRCRGVSKHKDVKLLVLNRKKGKSVRKTTYKICPNCEKKKRLEEGFGRRGKRELWNSWCKECHRERSRAYRRKNKEKNAEYMREYRKRS